jgi:cytochrome c556
MRIGKYLRVFMGFFLALSVLAGVHGFAGQGPATPAEIQKKRTATMKAINKHMRELKVAVSRMEFDRVASTATSVEKLIGQIPELSPEGSAFGPKTRILPAVWENFSNYEELTTLSTNAADSLAKVAKSQDQKKVMKAFLALAKSCTKCHKPYRKKKKRRR